jgi:DNA-binding MarR family transcriptional regulator
MTREPHDHPLGYLLHRVAASLRADVTASVLEPLDLGFPHYICLRLLAKTPGQSNAELAREIDVSPQAMNMVLRGLESRGLVTRPDAVASGRSLPATLTRSGIEMLERTDAGVRAAEDRLLAGISSGQQRELRRILEIIGG